MKLRYIQILSIYSKDFEYLNFKDSNIEIISSNKAGAGKSTKIKLDIIKKGKKYVHFPLGGSFSRKDIIE